MLSPNILSITLVLSYVSIPCQKISRVLRNPVYMILTKKERCTSLVREHRKLKVQQMLRIPCQRKGKVWRRQEEENG